MSTWFIDAKLFSDNGDEKLIKELCIMNVDDPLNAFYFIYYEQKPWLSLSSKARYDNNFLTSHYHLLGWREGQDVFCPSCAIESTQADVNTSLFYVIDSPTGSKINTIKKYFPMIRVTNYTMPYTPLPENISCPWRPHGIHCAYKQCFMGCMHYIKNM